MHQIILSKITKLILASSVGFGPIIVAYLFSPTNRVQPIKMTFIGNLFHLIMGSLFCSIPITYMCLLLLK